MNPDLANWLAQMYGGGNTPAGPGTLSALGQMQPPMPPGMSGGYGGVQSPYNAFPQDNPQSPDLAGINPRLGIAGALALQQARRGQPNFAGYRGQFPVVSGGAAVPIAGGQLDLSGQVQPTPSQMQPWQWGVGARYARGF